MAAPNSLLALITDLFFTPGIKNQAAEHSLNVEWLEAPEPAADFVARLHAHPPALIILDLDAALPWQEWLTAVKADPATTDIPWLAFGSHKAAGVLATARRLGADKVVPRSAFAAELAAWFQQAAGSPED